LLRRRYHRRRYQPGGTHDVEPGSTHIDPPAGAIAVGTLILNLAHGFIK
jgi:hypothetical protein